MHDVEFLSVFCASSQKFQILSIPNVLVHGESFEHSFIKKYNIHKLYVMSSFDRFFVHHLINSKYWPFPTY
ncbi:hypothetical protein BHE74_00046974 [Ensete ventricosum]|nr:hypothetical protein BHE74_00046974 [Ensete ventricosum]